MLRVSEGEGSSSCVSWSPISMSGEGRTLSGRRGTHPLGGPPPPQLTGAWDSEHPGIRVSAALHSTDHGADCVY